MQLTTYNEITTQLVQALKIQEILSLINQILTHPVNEEMKKYRQELPAAVHTARDNLHHLTRDPEFAAVASALRLNELFSSSMLTDLVLALHSQHSTHELRGQIVPYRALRSFYWPLEAFFRQTKALESMVLAGRVKGSEENEVLEFDVLELGQADFDPDRVTAIIPAVEKLFKGVALSLNEPLPVVRIAYLDSGSPLLIAFKAAPRLVKEVRVLLTELLLTLRDWRAEQKSRQIKVAMEGLEFCKKLHDAESAGVIGPEQAAQAKHLTMAAAVQLVKLGVVPRGEKLITIDPKMLVERAAQNAALPAPKLGSDSDLS